MALEIYVIPRCRCRITLLVRPLGGYMSDNKNSGFQSCARALDTLLKGT